MFVRRLWVQLSFVALSFVFPILVGAQTERAPTETEDLIGREITRLVENYPYRAGIFRIRPRLSAGTSYDSNVFSSSEIETSDYFTAISPGGSFALKLGKRAYFILDEDVSILFYKNQNELNDVFNTTQGKFGIGSRRVLVQLNGFYLKKLARVDPEVDQQIQQRYVNANLDLSIALLRGTDLNFHVNNSDANFEPADVPNAVEELPVPPDTRTVEYGGGVYQDLMADIALIVEGYGGYTDFTDLDPTDPTITSTRSNFYRILTGFDFRGQRFVGKARVGFASRDPIQSDQAEFRDFEIDTSIDYAVARRLAIGAFIQRRRSASALVQDSFRLFFQAGARGCVPISHALFVDGTIAFGRNDYGPGGTFEDQEITQDDFVRFDTGMNIALPKGLIVRVGTTYTNRTSNVDTLNKDRFTLNVGVGFDFGRGPVAGRAPSCSPVSMSF